MEEILISKEGLFPEACILEKMIHQEFEGVISVVILVQFPSSLTTCTMNLRNKQGQRPTTVVINLLNPHPTEKGKEITGTPQNPTMLNFILWNARGANSAIFQRRCEALVKAPKPALLVHLETKMADHKNITDALKFDAFVQSPAEGMPGGIVVMWKDDLVRLDNISETSQGIHVKIKVCPFNFSWFFIIVYASPDLQKCTMLWRNLIDWSRSCNAEWLVAGDSNEVLYANEKLGGTTINRTRVKLFWNCLQNSRLVDLGFKGQKFTWTNKRESIVSTGF